MTVAEAVNFIETVEERERIGRATSDLADAIFAQHLKAVEEMTPGERALLRE